MASEGVPAVRILDQQDNVQIPVTLVDAVTYYAITGPGDTGSAQFLGTITEDEVVKDVWYVSHTTSVPLEEFKANISGNSVEPVQTFFFGHQDRYDDEPDKALGWSHNWTQNNTTYTVTQGGDPLNGSFVTGTPVVHLEEASFVDDLTEPDSYFLPTTNIISVA